MKKMMMAAFALLFSVSSFAQLKVSVQVYPGNELISVVELLADSAFGDGIKSTYRRDLLRYFSKYKDERAVKLAHQLPYRNCDFPMRQSWAFYNFPDIKLQPLDNLAGYEGDFKLTQINDYFAACLQFYHKAKFRKFYDHYRPEYQRWIASFNRNLYEQGMLAAIDSFYRTKPKNEVIFTLGGLNCGTYATSDPVFKNKSIIMVAYGSVLQTRDSIGKHPDFYAPVWATQLIWHECGHVFLGPLFEENKSKVESLRYIMDRDTALRKAGSRMGWPMYLNENITQSVTSLLRIRNGKNDREAEMKRIADGHFYLLMPAIMDILEKEYYHNNAYKDFAAFFPVLLDELRKKYQ